MKKDLLIVLEYFGYFSYAPSFDEIYTFFPHRVSKKNLQILLTAEVRGKKILRLSHKRQSGPFYRSPSHYPLITNHSLYTLPQYSINRDEKLKIKDQKSKVEKNKWRIRAIQIYIHILKFIPIIRFVGITGASAMTGLDENDDLDLCIVTAYQFLWAARFWAVVCAKILGIHTKTGVCLNLFFDEIDLEIPPKKQNSYIAHELLQMKPIADKDHIYNRFLNENQWIYRYFPNAKAQNTQHITCNMKHPMQNLSFKYDKYLLSEVYEIKTKMLHATCYKLHEFVDRLFKSLQLPLIKHNHTALFITPTQLWLFKNDFEKKLKRKGLVI